MKNLIKNSQGIAMLQALMVTAFVGAAAGIIMSQTRLTESTLLIPRIRSDMLTAESAFRNLAYMNGTYVTPFGASAATVVGEGTGYNALLGTGSAVNVWLARFESTLNLKCPPATTCRVEFSPTAPAVAGNKYVYDQANRRLSTRIVYSGSSISIKPIVIDIIVPQHILTGAPFRCAAQDIRRPFFRGYLPNGNPNCTGWETNANAFEDVNGVKCNPGYIMTSINNTTMQITCTPMTANPSDSCAADQFISNLNWGAGAVSTYTCANRPNAFTYFGFTPTDIAVP